jgi:uncharacterized integral membrane protein
MEEVSPKKKKEKKSTWKVITAITPLLSLSLYMLHTLTAAFNSNDNPTELCLCLHVFLSAVVLLLLLQLQSTVKL